MVCPWLENGTVTIFIDSHRDLSENHRLQLVSTSKASFAFHAKLYARSSMLLLVSAIVGTLAQLISFMLIQLLA